MSEKLAEQLAQAREHVDAGFGPSELARSLVGLERRIRRRRQRKQAGSALLALAALAWLSTLVLREHEPRTAQRTLITQDGSVATALDAHSELTLARDGADEVALELKRGRGHFEVTPNPRRRYRVHAGQVDVEVLGTAFVVERQGLHTRVRVEHGSVRVSFRGGTATLRAGEHGSFPPSTAPTPLAPDPQLRAAPAPESAAAAPSAEPASARASSDGSQPPRRLARERWRVLARAGKHREAFGSLGAKPVEDLPGLLLAADAARLSGHPRDAARFLEHLVQRYPESAPARLAAFTLGRLALYELKQPGLAAQSFARAYALDPHGPLAEDALAREAEAYHRAGDARRAESAAQRYLERFPAGARRKELGRYTGAKATPAAEP